MSVAIPKPIESLSIESAAAEIVRLINSSPRTPRQHEIAAIISRVAVSGALVGSVAQTDADKARAEYLGLIDDLRAYCKRHEGYSAEEEAAFEAGLDPLTVALDQFEEKTWGTPARTWGDVLMLAEIALRNENGIMDALGNKNAYLDERAPAHLIDAVLTVGRRFFGHADDGRRSSDV